MGSISDGDPAQTVPPTSKLLKPFDPAMHPLGIYVKEIIQDMHQNLSTGIFFAELFVCLTIDLLNKLSGTHTLDCYVFTKNEDMIDPCL